MADNQARGNLHIVLNGTEYVIASSAISHIERIDANSLRVHTTLAGQLKDFVVPIEWDEIERKLSTGFGKLQATP